MLQIVCCRAIIPFALLIFCLACLNLQVKSQSIKARIAKEKHLFSAGIGMSGYYGDLNDQLITPYFAASVDHSYRLAPSLSFRSSFSLYTIRAADKDSKDQDLANRNLSFEAVNLELYGAFVLDLIPVKAYEKRPRLAPYFFIGAGLTTNNPTAKINGKRHALRPLMTEGNEYPGTVLVVPVGIGARLKVTRLVSLIVEYGYRFSDTDYLDDVSTVYPDPDLLPNDLSRQFSDRSPELGLAPRSPGNQRGNPGVKDDYMILSFRLETLFFELFSQKRKAWRR